MITTKTEIKSFKIEEIYRFYDHPLFFACRNESNLFFAFCADNSDSVETWLYASVSTPRFESVKKGETELRHIFTEAEDGFVYIVKIGLELKIPLAVCESRCHHIPDEYLPKFGKFIDSHPLTSLLEYPQR